MCSDERDSLDHCEMEASGLRASVCGFLDWGIVSDTVQPSNMFKAILFIWAIAVCTVGALEAPFAPMPGNGATNVLATISLDWGLKGTNLVRDGGFETFNPKGWVRMNGPLLGIGGARAYSGNLSVVLSSGTCRTIYQEIPLPTTAGEITLSWADKLEHAAAASNVLNWGVRVELWQTNNSVLRQVYTSPRNMPSTNDWALRSANISEFAGQTVRVAFTYSSLLEGGAAYIDDVAVNVTTNAQHFEVVVSTDAQFSNSITQTVTRPQAALTNLSLNSTYYWKVSAFEGEGTAVSPTWSFKTARETNSAFLGINLEDAPQAGYPMRISAQRFLQSGTTTNLLKPIQVAALAQTRNASVVFSSLNLRDGIVQALNVSAQSVSLTNWSVVYYDANSWPAPRGTLVIPSGVLAPRGVIIVREKGTSPGQFPNFLFGIDLAWGATGTNALAAVALYDAQTNLVDFACAGTAYPWEIKIPATPGIDQWRGGPIAINNQINLFRTGSLDSDTALDWFSSNASSSINVPAAVFERGFEVMPNAVAETSVDENHWFGSVIFPEATTNILLVANDSGGATGELFIPRVAPPYTVQLLPPATMTESPNSFEMTGTARIPVPLSTNLIVKLTSSDPLLEVGSLEFPAGQTNASFTLRLNDDALFNWERMAVISGDAGFLRVSPASIKLLDDEPVAMTITVPDRRGEETGVFNGEVRIDPPPPVDVVVKLEATAGVTIPGSIQFTNGQSSATFEGRIIDDRIITGDRDVSIKATINASVALATLRIADDEFTNRRLSLLIPPTVLTSGGARIFDCEAQLNAVSSGFVVHLSHDAGDRLQMPEEVLIPAGKTNVGFKITVPGSAYLPPQAFTVAAAITNFPICVAPIEIKREEYWSLPLGAAAQIFEKASQRLIVSQPTNNLVSWIDPTTGAIEDSIQVGSHPRALTVTADEACLYVALDTDHAIQRILLPSRTLDLLIPLGAAAPREIYVFPGTTNALAVESTLGAGVEVALYVDTNKFFAVPDATRIIKSLGRVFVERYFNFRYTIAEIQFDNGEFKVGDEVSPPFTGYLRQDPTAAFYGDSDFDFSPESLNYPTRLMFPDDGKGNLLLTTFSPNRLPAEPLPMPLSSRPTSVVGWGQNRVAFISGDKTWVMRSDRLRSGDPADLILSIDATPTMYAKGVWTVVTTVSNAGPAVATSAVVSSSFQDFQSVGGRSQKITKGVLRYSDAYPETNFEWWIGELRPNETQTCTTFLTTSAYVGFLGATVFLDNSQPDPTPQGLISTPVLEVFPSPDLKDVFMPIAQLTDDMIFSASDGILTANNRGSFDLQNMRRTTKAVLPWYHTAMALTPDGKAVWGGNIPNTLARYSYPDFVRTHYFPDIDTGAILALPGEPERIVVATARTANMSVPLKLVTQNGANQNKVMSGYVLRGAQTNSFFAYHPGTKVLDRIRVSEQGLSISASYPNLLTGSFFACEEGLLYAADGRVFETEGMSQVASFQGVEAGVNVIPSVATDRILFAIPGKLRIYELKSRDFLGELPFADAAGLRQAFFADNACALTANGALYFLRSNLLEPLKVGISSTPDGHLEIRFNTRPGKHYRLESASSPSESWSTFQEVIGDGSQAVRLIDSPSDSIFFRLVTE